MNEIYYFAAETINRGATYTQVWGWSNRPFEVRDGLLILTRTDASASVIPVCNLEYLRIYPEGDERIPEGHRLR